jgi:hypothetical protein
VAAKGKKNAKVKWAIGATEPDDLPDFQSNDDIVRKNKGALPPKGRTRVLVKKITKKENKNGDDMLTVTCEIAEKGSKSEQSFNGYAMWERLNVTEQGAPYLKRFLTAIGCTWNDFMSKTVADESGDPEVITQIGKVKIAKQPEAFVSVKHGVDQNDEDVAEVGRFLPPADEDEEPDDDDDDTDEDEDDDDIDVEDDDDDDDDESDDDDDDDEDDEEDDDDEDDEDAEEELRAELKPLKLAALKKRAIRAGADEDDMPAKKADLIDHIVELELESDDDDDDDEDDDEEGEDPEEMEKRIKAEVKKLDLTELRNRARANGRKSSELKGAKKPALVKMILEDEVPPF